MRLLRRFDHILKYKVWPFLILALMVLLFSFLITKYYPFSSKYLGSETEITGIVLKYTYDGDQAKILLKGKEKIWVYYYFDSEEEKNKWIEELKMGDTLLVTGDLEAPSQNTVPNTFDYRKYLYTQKIYYTVNASDIEKIKNNTSVLYYIKEKMYQRIDTYEEKTQEYLYTFILGNKDDLDPDIKSTYQQNGISHLFSISGMHISLFTMLLFKLVKKLSYNIYFQHYFVIFFLLIYMLFVEMSPSIVRTVLMFALFSVNKIYRLRYKKENLLFLLFIIMMIINPFYLYNMGFWLSYLISGVLVLCGPRLGKYRHYLTKSIATSIISFLMSFPIVIYNYCEINLLSILFNLIVVPLVSSIIFPLSLLLFLFPFLENIFLFFISILEWLSTFFSTFPTVLIFKKMSFFIMLLYYVVIGAIFYNKKFFLLFLFMMLLHKNIDYFDSSFNITFIDVGQGDSTLVKLPYHQGNILIDTGGTISYSKESWQEKRKEYHLTQNKTIPYLKSLGIDKIDYFILTHGDYDHMGEAIYFILNFKVEKVIFNCGEFNNLEQELIKLLDKKKIPYYSCIKELNIDDNKFYFLNNGNYDNENDNSLVVYTEFNNHKFLFMGDAGVEVEEDLIEKYNLKDIDVLKVGHHGSKTSSSKEFIDGINPKYSIISVGKNNRYGHPNDNVLDNLEDSKIYRTDIDGSVMFKINNHKLELETCTP